MRTITREHFIEAIEAGIVAARFEGWKAARLREHGRVAEWTLTYTFKYNGVCCPIIVVSGPSIGDDGWLFVFEFDKVASKHVVLAPGDDGPIVVAIRVIE